jgi:glycosyltransferase involved in cell wall biosynthesis
MLLLTTTLELVRVAVVTTSYPSSEGDPAGHFVRAEVRGLEREGHEVRVIAPAAGRRSGGGAFGWPGAAERLKQNPVRALDAAAWTVRARGELRRSGRLDRVVAHWTVPCVFPICMRAMRATGSRVEVEGVSHGGDVRALVGMPPPLRGFVTRAIARRVTTWRFVSEALLETLVGALAAGDAALVRRVARVAPSPIEIPDVRADVEGRRLAMRAPFAVAVGRLVEGKRVDHVLAHAAGRGETLVVVGDGPERPKLEAMARRLGMDARFVGTVTRREALAWIGAARVVYHASRAEGLSTVAREAEALGTRFEQLGP